MFLAAGAPVVGVSPDGADSQQRVRSAFGPRLPLLSDPEHRTLEAYGAWGERPGRGPGVIRSTFLIDERGTVRRARYGVKADGHASEVLAALEGLSVPPPVRHDER